MSDAAHSDATLNGNDGVIPVNDLSRAWLAQSEEALTAIQRVLSSGWYVHGQEHQRFESELAAFLDVPHALGVANGSDALVLALLAVGCGPGAEMITAADHMADECRASVDAIRPRHRASTISRYRP